MLIDVVKAATCAAMVDGGLRCGVNGAGGYAAFVLIGAILATSLPICRLAI
jgi:hypothetical protein